MNRPAATAELLQAGADWNSGAAYFDGRNFRVRTAPGQRGPIAPWNKAAKRAFEGCEGGATSGLHAFAKSAPGGPEWEMPQWAIDQGRANHARYIARLEDEYRREQAKGQAMPTRARVRLTLIQGGRA